MTVVEATGGSTGSALAFVCAVKGYRFHVVSSNAYAVDKLQAMAAFGAEVDLVKSPSGRITADLIPAMIERAKAIAQDDTYYSIDQFNNADAYVGYNTLGLKLVDQFPNDTAGIVMVAWKLVISFVVTLHSRPSLKFLSSLARVPLPAAPRKSSSHLMPTFAVINTTTRLPQSARLVVSHSQDGARRA
jgi:hypothetical protein